MHGHVNDPDYFGLMKRIFFARRALQNLLILSTLMSASDAFAQTDDRGYIVHIGDVMPEFTLTDIDGISYTNASLRGKTYVLQFTASWCGVCRKEMPHLEEEIWQVFQDRDFILLGVDLDEPEEEVRDFAAAMNITYPIAPDEGGKVFYSIAAPKSGVTRNVVVDENGVIRYLTRLFEPDEFQSMIELIDLLTK